MTDIEFMKMLIENQVLSPIGVFADGLRKVGWWIIGGPVSLVNGLEKVATKVYSFNDFFNSKGVNELLDAYKPLIFGILALALLFLGYAVMMGKKKDRSEIPTNILISAMIIISLPLFMTKLGDLTEAFVSYNISDQQSSAKEIVKDNVSDLYYLDRIGFKIENKKNGIQVDDITNIDINENLDSRKVSNRRFKDLANYKLIRNENGNESLIKLDKGFFGMFNEGYYRYNANFMIIIVSLGITGVTLLCIALKVAGIIFELGFKKIFATLLAMADISDGRKLKAIVMDIVSSFTILMVTSVILKLYVIFVAFLGNKFESYSIINLVILAGVSWKVIDAPDIVERILGIDAGVKSNWASVIAGYEGAKGVGRALMGTGRLAKKGVNAAKNSLISSDKKESNTQNDSGGIYGNEQSENNSNANNNSNNNNLNNNNSSGNKNNINKNDANSNINRNSGIYNKAGDNVNNKSNTNNSSKENSSSKDNGIYGKDGSGTNSDKEKFVNGNNLSQGNVNKDKGESNNINTNNGKPIYNNPNDSSKPSNIKDSKDMNNLSRNRNRPGNINNNNETIKNSFNRSNKANFNGVNYKNYNVGNQNKWNLKGKGNKK
ncbi:hypothetical protein KQH81_04540 [Clostridium cadaveris]|uniref:pLS20_p028 family conjugation system transmembrane protein n=1 Tax=Clostridium cadaveris TaxID=1529 RepID=UPI001E63D13D|nr:hypothetical protein [Clostridium cadaveris]UFH65811.1 hypothetical protein KQH81_04540 [Clostridium cadaveris]